MKEGGSLMHVYVWERKAFPTEPIDGCWIEILRFFAVRTDFTNMAVMLSDFLRNLTFNRSAHCTQVSDQCPLGLLFIFERGNFRKEGIMIAKKRENYPMRIIFMFKV